MTPTIELLPHNEKLYNEIKEQIEAGERSIFYSEATGLGKSFIFMRLVQDYFVNKRILYIVPKVAIWDNLTHYKEFSTLDTKIHMRTFASFNKYDFDDRLYDDYDVVFVDECHHMLSDIQGMNVAEFLEDMVRNGCYTFGMTATPFYKGTYVDEVWFNVSCYGYDVFEAIDKGILPKIKLALANINLDSIPNNLKAQFSITGTKPLLNRIIEEHSEINKWLAYFTDVKTLEQNVHEMQVLFPDYEILKIYEGMGNETEVFRRFEDSNRRVVLMSVNKLLEGIHLDNVEGVLLYRNVVEFSTWMQMYGRLCNIHARTTPVFLDITNSIISISKISEFKSSRFTGESKKYELRDLFDVNAKDYWTLELAEILLLQEDSDWSDDEDNILIENYPNMGIRVSELLPKRTRHAIYTRANRIGLSFENPLRFEQWEDNIIVAKYAKYGCSICSQLNNRSSASVKQRAHTLGLRYDGEKPTLDEEVDLLKDMRNNGVILRDIVEELNKLECNISRGVVRDLSYVKGMVQRYGIFAEKSCITNDMLMKYVYEPTRTYIVSRLSGERYDLVYQRYARLCTKPIPYTISEMTYIRDNMDRLELDDLVEYMNSSVSKSCLREMSGVDDHIKVIKGLFKYNMPWTKEECDVLWNYYPLKGIKYVQNIIFYRPISGIVSKVSSLGIKLQGYTEPSNYDFKFRDELYRNVDISSLKSLSEFSGRSIESIRSTIKRNNWSASEFVDCILDNSYKGYHLSNWASSLAKDGYPADIIQKYRRSHTVEETIDYMVSGDYKSANTTSYKGIILKSPRAVSLQLGISTSNWDKYKNRTNDETLLGYAKYWYNRVIELGKFSTEDELDKFIRSKQLEFGIKVKF